MKFGFDVPLGGPLATPEELVTMAQRGEEMGFDIISGGDHIVFPRSIDSRYPYGETGIYPDDTGVCVELLTALSFLAGLTSTIRLLPSVIVLPYRNPIHTAKILASLDVLSKGRVIVGCGIGWMREEFENLGSPPFDERGAVGDEYIQSFKELWTSENPTFHGKYCNFSNIDFLPKPVQRPHPPIWIGGESPPALRRVARLGDAWYPIGNNPRFPVNTPEQLSEYRSRLHRYAVEAGRDPSTIEIAYSADWYNDREAQVLPNGERRIFTGVPEQVAEDIRKFEQLGVGYLMFGYPGNSPKESLAGMERFATKVRPLI